MDGFIALIVDLVEQNGLGHAELHQTSAVVTLQGISDPRRSGICWSSMKAGWSLPLS